MEINKGDTYYYTDFTRGDSIGSSRWDDSYWDRILWDKKVLFFSKKDARKAVNMCLTALGSK